MEEPMDLELARQMARALVRHVARPELEVADPLEAARELVDAGDVRASERFLLGLGLWLADGCPAGEGPRLEWTVMSPHDRLVVATLLLALAEDALAGPGGASDRWLDSQP